MGDELLHAPDRPPVLFTTGTQAAIDSLTERMAVVEEAIRQLTAAVELVTNGQTSRGVVSANARYVIVEKQGEAREQIDRDHARDRYQP